MRRQGWGQVVNLGSMGGKLTAGRKGRGVRQLGPSPVDFPASPEHPAALKVRVLELP